MGTATADRISGRPQGSRRQAKLMAETYLLKMISQILKRKLHMIKVIKIMDFPKYVFDICPLYSLNLFELSGKKYKLFIG